MFEPFGFHQSRRIDVGAARAKPAPLPRDRLTLLATGLAGSLLIGTTSQLMAPNIGAIGSAIGASANAASWLSTAYTMAQLVGIVLAIALIPAFGLRRAMAASASLFALAALAGAAAPSLPAMVALRAAQGLAAGAFGPIAFAAVFMTTAGPRLPFGLALLAIILLLPAGFGPAAGTLIAASFGWQSLFLAQAAAGAALVAAALTWMPRTPLARAALDRDWTGVLALGVALAATMLVLGQGARRVWLESDLIVGAIVTALLASIAVAVTLRRSPQPVVDIPLLARPAFIRPIALYLLFRGTAGASALLVPPFLMLTLGIAPVELAPLLLWSGAAQLLAFPLAWALLQRVDGRFVIAAGLLGFALAILLIAAGGGVGLTGDPRLALALAGAAQVMFLVPNLIAGAGTLKPADGPTAALVFNAATIGGSSLGAALAGEAPAADGILALGGGLLATAALLGLAAVGVLSLRRQPALRPTSATAVHSRPIG